MVWDNWNPWKDLGDEWGASHTVWGKLKVILFYSFVWLAFIGSAYQVFVPFSMGMDCLLGNSSKQKSEIAFAIRQYALFSAAWLLFVAKGKTHLPNMRVLVTVVILSCVFSFFWEGKDILRNDGECSSNWMTQWWWWVGWPILAMILAYIERHTDGSRGNSAETQALV